jgi:hypothetical protein
MVTMNITTLDNMKGLFKMTYDAKRPNPFDLGFWTNIALFF